MKKKCFCRLTRLFLLLLAVPLVITSCSSDDSIAPVVEVTPPQRPIRVEVSENQLVNTAGARQQTRADITFLTSFNYFEMRANNDRYTVTKNVRGWTVDGSWPVADDNTSVTFYAYNYVDDEENDDLDYIANNGSPYISFTTESKVPSSQHDLLVATTTTTYAEHNGTVLLTFDHACAALLFSIYKTSGVAGRTITVKKIVLGNVYKTGSFHFAGNSWDSLDEKTEFELYNAGMEVTTEATEVPDLGYMFVIPQEPTAWVKDTNTDGAYLDVTLTIDGTTTKTGRIPFSVPLVKGEIQPVSIAIGTSLKDENGNRIFQ